MGDSNVTNYQKAVQGTGKNAIFNTLGETSSTPADATMSCLKAAAGSDPQWRQVSKACLRPRPGDVSDW